MLRIAQLANFVGPTSGGLRRAVDHLGAGYVAAGHDRLLVIPGRTDHVETTSESGTVVTVASPRVSGMYRMVTHPGTVLRVLDEFGPTSVEVSDKWTMTAAARWARRRRVRSVLLSHERLDDMASMFLRFNVRGAVRGYNRYLARRYDQVVVTSRYSAAEWARTRARLRLIALGVDLDTFTPRDPGASDVLRLVYSGRLSREKSPHLAVATAVELHRRGVPLRLDLFGVGPDQDELVDLAEDTPVEFRGYADSRLEVAKAYGAADISLSVCPHETFGLAVLEALACGTPVVTSDRGGARELVRAPCAEWGAPDPSSLADAVERLSARLRADASAVRTAARSRAEQFPWSATVAAMVDVHAAR